MCPDRYDVEVFQRIETLIGLKMDRYPAEEEVPLRPPPSTQPRNTIVSLLVKKKQEKSWNKAFSVLFCFKTTTAPHF